MCFPCEEPSNEWLQHTKACHPSENREGSCNCSLLSLNVAHSGAYAVGAVTNVETDRHVHIFPLFPSLTLLLTGVECRRHGVDTKSPAAHFHPSLICDVGCGVMVCVWISLIDNLKKEKKETKQRKEKQIEGVEIHALITTNHGRLPNVYEIGVPLEFTFLSPFIKRGRFQLSGEPPPIHLSPHGNETCNLRLRVAALNEPWLSVLHHGAKCLLWSASPPLHHNTQNSRRLPRHLRPTSAPTQKQRLMELEGENTLRHVAVVVVGSSHYATLPHLTWGHVQGHTYHTINV